MLNTKHIQAIAEIDTPTLQFYLEKQGFECMAAQGQGELFWQTYRSTGQGYEIDVFYKLDTDLFHSIIVREI